MTEVEQLEHEIREADNQLAEIGRSHDRLIEERDGLALAALRGDQEADTRAREILDQLGDLEHKRALANVVRRNAGHRLEAIREATRHEEQREEGRRHQDERQEALRIRDFTMQVRRDFAEMLGGTAYYTTPVASEKRQIAERCIATMAAEYGARYGEEYGQNIAKFCRETILPALGQDSSTMVAGSDLAAKASGATGATGESDWVLPDGVERVPSRAR